MNISQESDYALRSLRAMYSIGVDKKVEAKVIADKERIPLRFLFKILRKLCAQDIVKSYRGAHGGYMLATDLDHLTIRDIVEIIEGPISINKCTYDKGSCELCQNGCTMYFDMLRMEEEIIKALSKRSLKEIFDTEVHFKNNTLFIDKQ